MRRPANPRKLVSVDTLPRRCRKPGAAAALALAAVCTLANSEPRPTNRTPSLVLRFQPVAINGRAAFHVVESFRALQPETEIVVPTHYGGAAHLEAQTQNLRLDSPGATLTAHPADAGEKHCTPAPANASS